MTYVTDPADPRLGYGFYLVLSEEERAKGFVRPYRDTYRHVECPVNSDCAHTFLKVPSPYGSRHARFYGGTYCVACRMHKPVREFVWDKDNEVVGS
jgi:hypothetical protein